MVTDGLSRNVVNQRVGRIVRAFKWAGSEEFVPTSVYQSLRTVDGIRRGRSAARETEPVKPVPEAFVDAVRPHVSAQVWAMIELQRLSAMRPNEVVTMRTADLDTSDSTWAYRPASHKMEHKGRGRIVFLGPRAQAILHPWFCPSLEEYLFQPREASAARRAAMRAARKTPVQPSQRDRSKPGARRRPGLRYTVATYRAAIYRACKAADVPTWSPNRLRHNAATRLRREFGLDTAQAVLGHASADVTQVYAELDHQRATEAMLRIG
jgi:integrase